MDDAVARYRSASERNDMQALAETLAPEVELVSPISGRMVFRGSADVLFLLTAVYGSLSGLRWSKQVSEDTAAVLIGEGKVAGVRMGDAMVFELASDGRIAQIRPHLRPWLALTLFALVLGPKVATRPGVVLRALRGG
jgi:hypothetical protein